MFTDQQLRQFRNDGFIYYGDVLRDDELQSLRDALDRTVRGESAAKPEAMRNMSGGDDVVIQIVNIWEAEPAFYDHLYNDRIVPLAAQLMGTDTVRVWHDQVQIKPSHVGGPTKWHQDHPYWPVIQPADLVSAWVALDDATISNGCMSMVRGSHKWGPYNGGTVGTDDSDWGPAPEAREWARAHLPAGQEPEVVPIEVPAGAVVFHHCLTWHGAPPNRSDRSRPAIAVHYMPGHTRYDKDPRKTHLVEHNIKVQPGEILTGDHFPTVMENGRLLTPAKAA
jgi:ectoine hydroxylase-related dioxygenase (phytanoyl-CoA dioxygenase family)